MTTGSSNQSIQQGGLLLATAIKLWPELKSAERIEQRRGLGVILSAAYGWLIFGAALIWLLSVTQLPDIRIHWIVAPILILLRIAAGQLDLTSLLLSDVAFSKGSAGRFITWSAVLIFGPAALWLDIIAILAAAIINWPKKKRVEAFSRSRFWPYLSELPTISVRDTFPALLALALLSAPDISSPIMGPIGQQQLLLASNGLYATLIKTGLSICLMIPFFVINLVFINQPTGILTGLLIGLRSLRFGFGSLISLGFPDLVGLITASFYSLTNPWTFIFVLTGLTLFALFVHYLNLRGLRSKTRLKSKEILEKLSQTLISEAPHERDYPTLLGRHLPVLFPNSLLEIALINGEFLFGDNENQSMVNQDLFNQLEISGRSFLKLQFDSENNLNNEVLAVPINGRENQQLIGAIALAPGQDGNVRDELLLTMYSLASQLAASLHQTELFEKALNSQAEAFHDEMFAQVYEAEMTIAYQQVSQELALAGQIQNSFLPENIPDIPGWEITVTLEPARETSGDYYDFIPLPEGLFGLLIADVTDKGIGAALYMALSRTLIRTFALEFYREPAKVLEAANRRILQDSKSDLFVTVCYLVLDPIEGQIIYCNAGHNPPYLWANQRSDEPLALTRTALPLGIFDDEEWQQNTIQLLPGDILTLYTDGITEAQDEDEGFFGEDRLKKVISENLDKSALIIEDKILAALSNFTADAPQSDDITLMIVRRE